MGCDIHMFIEFGRGKSHTGEQLWECFGGGDYGPGRDYHMFSYLADCGRNGETEPVVPNRGLPEGELSWDTQHAMDEGSDLHSHTWLTPDEYAQAYAQRMLSCPWGPPAMGYELILLLLQELKGRGIPARVVIAFDC
jgi:hypothetical protein